MNMKMVRLALITTLLLTSTCFVGIKAASEKSNNADSEKEQKCSKGFWEGLAVIGAGAKTAAVVATKVINVAGFQAAGIVQGSLAAAAQSTYGTGAAFSAVQSVAMTGGVATLGAVGVVGGIAAGAIYYYWPCTAEASENVTE